MKHSEPFDDEDLPPRPEAVDWRPRRTPRDRALVIAFVAGGAVLMIVFLCRGVPGLAALH